MLSTLKEVALCVVIYIEHQSGSLYNHTLQVHLELIIDVYNSQLRKLSHGRRGQTIQPLLVGLYALLSTLKKVALCVFIEHQSGP